MYRFMKVICLTIIMAFSFNAKADFNKGLDAYDTGNYEEAFKEWLESAESGDLAAQRNIGQLYRWGRGVEKSPEKAFYWYKKASDKGFHEAQYSLALMYLNGEGVEQNEKEGIKLLKIAAKKGSYNAERKLIEISDIVERVENENKEQVKEVMTIKESEKPLAVVPLKAPVVVMNTENAAPKVAFEKKTSKEEIKKPVEFDKNSNVKAPEVEPKATKKVENVEPKKVEPKAKAEPQTQKTSLKQTKKQEILNAHLASYHDAAKANAGIEEISKKFKIMKNLKTSLKYIYLKEKGEIIRLYASGNADDIKSLCDEMKKAKFYCKIEK